MKRARVVLSMFLIVSSFSIKIKSATKSVTLNQNIVSGNTAISGKLLEVIHNFPNKDLMIEKINSYYKQLNDTQKELFVEMMNVKTSNIFGTKKVAENIQEEIDNAYNMARVVKGPSFFKRILSSVFSNGKYEKMKISDLFDRALQGDGQALSQIKDRVQKTKNISDQEFKKMLMGLQDKAYDLVKRNDQLAGEEQTNIMTLEHEDQQLKMSQDAALRYKAEEFAINKRCKDIIKTLQPLCSDSQKIIFTIDRQENNPLVNLIDMKDLPMSMFDQKDNIDDKLSDVSQVKDIQVPIYRETKPQFLQQLKDAAIDHHSTVEARKKFNIAIGNHEDKTSLDVSVPKELSKDPEFRAQVQKKFHELFVQHEATLHSNNVRQGESYEMRGR